MEQYRPHCADICQHVTVERLEIIDLIAQPPVHQAAAAARLRASGQERAARLIEALPATDGVLDAEYCRLLLRRIHAELQRLGEELQLPRRVAADITQLTRSRLQGQRAVHRIIDVGCGTGHVLRSLARANALPGVELVATDFNADLLDMGRSLVELDGGRVRFEQVDALSLVADETPSIVISTGLLHHLPAADLAPFLARHEAPGVLAFLHYDPEPGWLTNVGSWIFHLTRMREPISRHDGNLSMRRAYPTAVLLRAARAAAPSFDVECAGGQTLLGVWRPLTGVRK